jgi:hypothetical protein
MAEPKLVFVDTLSIDSFSIATDGETVILNVAVWGPERFITYYKFQLRTRAIKSIVKFVKNLCQLVEED